MSIFHKLSVTTALVLGLGMPTGSSFAQNTLPNEAATGVTKPAQIAIRALQVLEQVGVILPGIGFNSVAIGAPVAQLVARWGPPQKLVKKKILVYQLDDKTLIQFFGKKQIEKIVVTGLPGSLARVNNGVIFGMTPAQVASRFKTAPDTANNEQLRYDDLGIELTFNERSLHEIEVFKP